MSNLDRYKKDLEKLSLNAIRLQIGMLKELGSYDSLENKDELDKIKSLDFQGNYESWYSESYQLIKQILPDRLEDFKVLYKNEKRKKTEYSTYTISDYLINLKVTSGYQTIVDSSAAFPKFKQQTDILNSVKKRFESSLFEIKQLVQADLFDSELDAAEELNKKKFYRGAGALTGVVIEKHLRQVCENHGLKITKKHPTISDFNELLKKEEVIEVKDWRFIQHLGDLRNLCDHNKDKEPTKDDIEDLINGVKKITKTIY